MTTLALIFDTHSLGQSGRYDLASDTGALSRIVARLRDMNTSTTIVARNGSDDRNCDATEIPPPCAKNCAMVTPPNRDAPITTRTGRHGTHTTSASAVQP